MFKVRVIPCLDVKDGRVVKGVNFVNLRDAGDPVAASIDDIRALLEPRAQKLAGAIAGRALYDGRLDAAEALALLRSARATA
jgi:phosphoribosylformimino-5-aminoimidazole carboxamide ribonucleotide (ProFAR) isomerase